jgi:dGTPase
LGADTYSVTCSGPVPGFKFAHGLSKQLDPSSCGASGRYREDAELHAHSASLAGKCQLFFCPEVQSARSRLDHCKSVAMASESLAMRMNLDSDLAYCMGLLHDCGHGPGGHEFERAVVTVSGLTFDHASWGADLLAASGRWPPEVINAVRHHTWELPQPSTLEGELVSWVDRIDYLTFDYASIVGTGVDCQLPKLPAAGPSELRSVLLDGVLAAYRETGMICLEQSLASSLDALYTGMLVSYRSEPFALQSKAVSEALRTALNDERQRSGSWPKAIDSISRLTDSAVVDRAALDARWQGEFGEVSQWLPALAKSGQSGSGGITMPT